MNVLATTITNIIYIFRPQGTSTDFSANIACETYVIPYPECIKILCTDVYVYLCVIAVKETWLSKVES